MLDLVSVMVFGEVTTATGVCVALVRVTTCGVFWSPSFATAAGGEGLWTIGDGGGAIGLRRSSRTASCVAARAKLSATTNLSTRPAMRNARRAFAFVLQVFDCYSVGRQEQTVRDERQRRT